jgi:biopolymer transport protein ExbB
MAQAFMQTCQRSKTVRSCGFREFAHWLTIAVMGVVVLGVAMSGQAFGQAQPYGQYPTISTSSIPAPPSIPSVQQEPNAELVAVNEDGEAASASWFELPLLKRIAAGGWLMLPLAVCSLIVFSLTIERLIALRRSRVIPRPFVRRFTECVEDGQLSYEEATEICEEFDCPVAEVFQAAVKRWGRPMLEIEQAVMDAGDRVADGLKRFLRVFHAISNVAPLIGLLGTVLGMIDSFESMSSVVESGNSEMLAAGISTALITTAGGLCVAIPAYLSYMYFSSKSDQYLNEIDRLCQRVIDCISAEGLESGNKTKKTRRAA